MIQSLPLAFNSMNHARGGTGNGSHLMGVDVEATSLVLRGVEKARNIWPEEEETN